MASALWNKIYVNNSTGVSLNERFTSISTEPKITVGRRSRSVNAMQHVNKATTRANQRFLVELQRKHKIQAALTLKRRSMRTLGGARSSGGRAFGSIELGNVKTLFVGTKWKPIRTNSLANIATLNFDRGALNKRPVLRRSNSSAGLVNRPGSGRRVIGVAAQRSANRRLERQRGGVGERPGRSVSAAGVHGLARNRSLTRPQVNARSSSRGRNANNAIAANRGRSGSRNRNPVRYRVGNTSRNALPITARLGVFPGTYAGNRSVQKKEVAPDKNRRGNGNRRNASLTRRGVQTGRVQKRQNAAVKNNIKSNLVANARNSRPRSRSAIRNANPNNNGQQRTPRSRSRTGKGQVGQQMEWGQGPAQTQQQRRRGRSQKRGGAANNNTQKGSYNNLKNNLRNSQQQRGGRGRTGGRGGEQRNQGGKEAKPNVNLNKDVLDMELDLYMATNRD